MAQVANMLMQTNQQNNPMSDMNNQGVYSGEASAKIKGLRSFKTFSQSHKHISD